MTLKRTAQRLELTRRLQLALLTPTVLLLMLALVLGGQLGRMWELSAAAAHTDRVLAKLYDLQREIIDQETAVRGYMITERTEFLLPFERARVSSGLSALKQLVRDDPAQLERLRMLRRRYEDWLARVRDVREGEIDQHRNVETMRARKLLMDSVRDALTAMLAAERETMELRARALASSRRTTSYLFVGLFAAVGLSLAFLSRKQLKDIAEIYEGALRGEREARSRIAAQEWGRIGHTKLTSEIMGEHTLEDFARRALDVVASYVGADVGALFLVDGDGARLLAGYGLDEAQTRSSSFFRRGEGIVGRTLAQGAIVHMKDVPSDYLRVRSGTGSMTPRELVLLPARVDGRVRVVLELGFLGRVEQRALDMLGEIGESLAISARTAEHVARLNDLLEESQRQGEELQAQQEELRATNEELEERGRTLRDAQALLEERHEELVATNARLEEQAESLARARTAIEEQAEEVARASHYKSAFLANMSHELRTPLNSVLILAKLLSENDGDNLTPEQVKFAETIHSAGSDLLTLINDVLDLAKIESGKAELTVVHTETKILTEGLRRMFEPLARDKGLDFEVVVDASAPPSIETDASKLGQIMRNLLGNAIKFTSRGKITLRVAANAEHVLFSVRDTGIGIAERQLTPIFEAFHQVDDASTRKYGGTGLGLSISRDLARLLGGDIHLESALGAGSTFTLTLPIDGEREDARCPGPTFVRTTASPTQVPGTNKAQAATAARAQTVLVVEDDVSQRIGIERILESLDVRITSAGTVAESIRALQKRRFDCMVLDLGLPDGSGFEMLESLEKSGQHAPVAVVVYTARSLSADEEQRLRKHSRSIIVKDARSPERLLDEVGRALRGTASEPPPSSQRRIFKSKGTETVLEGRTILVVEDDVRNIFALSSILEPKGATVLIARNGLEALSMLDAHPEIALVLMDMMMPEMDGLEATRRIRANPAFSRLPIIALTAKAMSDDKASCLEAGANDYVSKPFEIDTLLSLIRVWMPR